MGTGQWLFVAGVAAACAVGLASVVRRWRHRQALADLARQLDLIYTPDDRLDLPTRYRSLAMFRRGHNHRASQVISGATSRGAICCFRYEYEVGFGVNRQVRCWGMAVIESDLDLPHASLGPAIGEHGQDENWLDTVPDMAGAVSRRGDMRTCSQSGDAAATLEVELADWAAGLNRSCGLQTCGRLIAVFVAGPVSPTQYEWLIRVVREAAERIRRPAVRV